MRGLECAQDVLSGAAAGIEPASGLELFKSCLVEGSSLALFVWPKRAAAIRAFLPAKTQPAQVFKHRFGKSHLCPNRVDIIATQDQNTLSLRGPLVSRPEGASVADVQVARWRGCQSATILNATHVPRAYQCPEAAESVRGEKSIQFVAVADADEADGAKGAARSYALGQYAAWVWLRA